MLILYQQRSLIDYLLVLVIIDIITDIGWTWPSCKTKDSYGNDYRVDISYVAYWIKNLLF